MHHAMKDISFLHDILTESIITSRARDINFINKVTAVVKIPGN